MRKNEFNREKEIRQIRRLLETLVQERVPPSHQPDADVTAAGGGTIASPGGGGGEHSTRRRRTSRLSSVLSDSNFSTTGSLFAEEGEEEGGDYCLVRQFPARRPSCLGRIDEARSSPYSFSFSGSGPIFFRVFRVLIIFL